MADVTVNDQGSIVVLVPMNEAATDWFVENLPENAPMWGLGYAVERRYVLDILEGLKDAGLSYSMEG